MKLKNQRKNHSLFRLSGPFWTAVSLKEGSRADPNNATLPHEIGAFDASLKPVLQVNSGDLIRLETSTGNPRYFEKLPPGLEVDITPKIWRRIHQTPPYLH
jgi:hypothetical protein